MNTPNTVNRNLWIYGFSCRWWLIGTNLFKFSRLHQRHKRPAFLNGAGFRPRK